MVKPIDYIGAKYQLSTDIIKYMPDHKTYVEVFGGSAGVLFNKDPSEIEVYNDFKDDLVNFFIVLRDNHEDLVDFLRETPYSRSYMNDLQYKFYTEDERPDDPVRWAGEFWYLQFTGIKSVCRVTGLSTSGNPTKSYHNTLDSMEEFSDRLENVIVENRDWSKILRVYDSEETFFYFDPPYTEVQRNSYSKDDLHFEHEEFVEAILELDGMWALSYGELPEVIEDLDLHIEPLEPNWAPGANPAYPGQKKKPRENIVMNYDPVSCERFVSPDVKLEGDW